MDLSELIKKLSETAGVSGHEAAIRDLVRQEFSRFADEVQIDRMGNVAAIRRGSGKTPRRRVMLAAHMDEIGLMVSGIQHGFLRISPDGGVDPRVLQAQEVIVHGRRELPGVVVSTPPHLQSKADIDKTTPIENLWIDIGLSQRQAERLVRVGDLASFRREMLQLKEGLLAGKAFDNRVSVAALTVCLEMLAEQQHAWDVVAVATIQEETTLLGAATSAFKHAPDVAIAVDVSFGEQNGASETDTIPVGKGPSISLGPNLHPKVVDKLFDVARRIEMTVHTEVLPGGSGTDAWAIQIARDGIPCGLIGIPLKSMHTPVETVAVKDVERAARLLAAFISELDEAFYESLTE